MKYFIGVDIGTTHAKVVVADSSCHILAEIKKTYKPVQAGVPDFEQDPDDLFNTVMESMKEAIATIADKVQIASISFSAAMHSLMALDKNNRPLTPLYTWSDIRSAEQAKLLKSSSEGKKIYESTGTPIHAMSPLTKIAWIREERPTVFKQAAKFISGKEYLFYRLFEEFVIDHSLASATGMFNFSNKVWDESALKYAGIHQDQLSTPVSVMHALTGLKPMFCDYLSIPSTVPFIIGSSDGVLANIGSGAVAPGEAALTIGTSGAIRSLINHPYIDSSQRLFNYAVDGEYFLSGGAMNNGGNVLKWFIEVFGPAGLTFKESINQLTQEAKSVTAASAGLIFLPYINGERAPVWDAGAKGAFIGITAKHTRAHFFRAVLEGIAFSLRQILEAMESSGERISTVYASGGFIESQLWLQIITDVLGKELKVSYAADASALGAVFLGMKQMNLIKNWLDVKEFVRTDNLIQPDLAAHSAYEGNYQVFAGLYQKLASGN